MTVIAPELAKTRRHRLVVESCAPQQADFGGWIESHCDGGVVAYQPLAIHSASAVYVAEPAIGSLVPALVPDQ